MISILNEMKKDSNNLPLIKEIVEKHKMPDIEAKDLISEIDSFKPTHNWTPPRLVQVPKPNSNKKRDLFIFNDMDSYFMKLINKVLYDNFADLMHENVFSYKKKTRTFDAAKHVQECINDTRLFGLKLDISDYFGSVKKETIFQGINSLDITNLDKLMLTNIFSIKGCYRNDTFVERKMGIMAGAAISAFFANYLLNDLDNYITQNTIVYARYSDDLVYFTESEVARDKILLEIEQLLRSKGLKINPKKVEYLDTDTPIEFLGLKISKDEIDIGSGAFKDLKRTVKKLIEGSRTWKGAINRLNRKLYRNIFDVKSEHQSNRMHYIFSNITTDKTLKKLDHYTTDRLRAKLSGRNNKHNTRIPISLFEKNGYESSVQLWNIFKIHPEAYMTEISILGKDNSTPIFYSGLNIGCQCKPKAKYRARNFEQLYEVLMQNDRNYIIFNNTKVYPEYLQFDLVNMRIMYQGNVIAHSNKMNMCKFLCNIQDRNVLIELDTDKVSECEIDDPDILLLRYLIGTYTENTGKRNNITCKGNINAYFRKYRLNDIIQTLPLDKVDMTVSYEIRLAKFLAYMYAHIATNHLWHGLNYEHEFITYSNYGFPIVIKKSLLLKE